MNLKPSTIGYTFGFLLLLVASGCGIPVDANAKPVEGVPPDLLQTKLTTSAQSDNGTNRIYLYFVDADNNLVSVQRNLSKSPDVNDILARLATDPQQVDNLENPNEIDTGTQQVPVFSTRLLPELQPRDGGYDATNKLQKVVVSEKAKLADLEPVRLRIIFSQIVCSLTENPNHAHIEQVSIFEPQDDKQVQIFAQNSSGEQTQSPSNRKDYDCENAIPLVESIEAPLTKRSLERPKSSSQESTG